MARRAIPTILFAFTVMAAAGLWWMQSGTPTSLAESKSPTAVTERKPPKGQNRLIFESSPYLLQHAANPVDWYPWGEAAFARARKENKPIFLSIGYSTCYWCHVMERESFADPETAVLMNKYFVSIKVDREERPDVDEIYMTAVQMMTGRGGWPMTVLLTPDLKPFFGGTYIPRPRLQQLLAGAHKAWVEQRDQIEEHAQRIAGRLQQATALPGKPAAKLPDLARVRAAVAQYAQAFDQFHGGFGPAPKFPQPSILEMLLTHYEISRDKKSLDMVVKTLDAMARGGIHDQIGGGFHRYSTDDEWLVPHFEKMLYDNAQLLHVYARAYKITGDANFKRVAEDIVDYVRRDMTGPDGLFYSAQDSEVDTHEGKSYVWTPEEVERVLSRPEYALARRVYGLDGEPSFEEHYILHWPDSYAGTAKREGMNVAQLMQRLAPIRAKLLAARERRQQPHLDDKSITAWNGHMIGALAYAGEALGRKEYVAMATRAAGALLATLRDKQGQLLHVARHGRAKLDAYLDDYGATILALTELERVTQDARWRVEALNLADMMIDKLWDPSGGFHYAPASVAHLIARTKDSYDGPVPSGNSLAVRALITLAKQDSPRYAGYAAVTLRAYGPVLDQAPRAMPYMLWGVADYRRANLAENAAPPVKTATIPTTAELVTLHATLPDTILFAGKDVTLNVALTTQKGWHVNANPASLDFLIPTAVGVSLAQGELRITPVYPMGKLIDAGLGSEKIAVYEGRIDIPARLTTERLPPDETKGTLAVSVRAQACNDTGRCLAPATLRTTILVRFERQ